MRSLAVAALLALTASPALAERPRLDRVPWKMDPDRTVGAVVNSKTIFLNRCKAGCKVLSGFTDSRTNKSAIGAGTLSAFEHGDTAWNGVVTCMKDVFKRFNVEITDVDPGPNVDHFEVMVAGSPGQIGLPSNVGGIAEYSCTSPGTCSRYMPDALVFAFANTYPNDPDEICATAAQEIAHTWSLDHVTDASDPMTYFNYSGRRQFKDGVMCGSDCVNGQSPFGLTCSGNSHTCMSTGTSTQNDVQILTALFGPAGAKAPTLDVKNPKNATAVQRGFTVEASCTPPSGTTIQEVDLYVDGVMKASLSAAPFTFTTSTTIPDGPHKVMVLCATTEQAIATKTVDVILGAPCDSTSMCAAGYLCFSGACIAGPETPGGLGATCTDNSMCAGGTCASDGMTSACTIPCDLNAKNCPDGYGCLEAGPDQGVCWAGYDDGGGCCDSRRDPRGSILLSLGIAALWITRRSPRKRARKSR